MTDSLQHQKSARESGHSHPSAFSIKHAAKPEVSTTSKHGPGSFQHLVDSPEARRTRCSVMTSDRTTGDTSVMNSMKTAAGFKNSVTVVIDRLEKTWTRSCVTSVKSVL